MSEENVYIGGTSIQIGQHGFINQPKEIIEYIKYLHKEIERLNNIKKKAIEYVLGNNLDNFNNINNLLNILKGYDKNDN